MKHEHSFCSPMSAKSVRILKNLLSLLLLNVVTFLHVADASSTASINVSFNITTRYFTDSCATGLINPGDVYLQVRDVKYQSLSSYRPGPWRLLEKIKFASEGMDDHFGYNRLHQFANTTNSSLFQLRLIQLEHGGGYCNCWGVDNRSISVTVLPGVSEM